VSRILFIFLDGVGLGPAGWDNPLSHVPMPHLFSLLGGSLVLDNVDGDECPSRQDVTLRALDACLGVPGLPQSATGQTALFTGLNAPALVGEHITARPTTPLREIIAEHSFLKRAAEKGAKVLFANAHSKRYWEMTNNGQRRVGASTATALAAGAPIPNLEDLAAGRAVLWDITHEVANSHMDYELPLVSPEQAGANLARLAADYDLVLYETFLTDLAGHQRVEADWVLTRVDRFLGAVLTHRTPDTTVVVSSDHGNLEDSRSRRHTMNPVPLLVVGPQAGCFCQAEAITDVAPAILASLNGPEQDC
jgi:2,3-bisphosphoglycerate-independent phosphoglycerate mutase